LGKEEQAAVAAYVSAECASHRGESTLRDTSQGFTLIEMSIVLVIIGLVVGGILVGQDLIKAAAIRAQVTQIDKFNQAVNTFYGKYQALPGDIPAALVSAFGFTATPVRSGLAGQGDGNGELDGTNGGGTQPYSWSENGENLFFWEDLSTNSKMISGGYSGVTGD
jgi:prepilin-type N-terminal cleavage/methylation domain-containing protein